MKQGGGVTNQLSSIIVLAGIGLALVDDEADEGSDDDDDGDGDDGGDNCCCAMAVLGTIKVVARLTFGIVC